MFVLARLQDRAKEAFIIPDLVSNDYSYVGPTIPSDASNLCKCNTVVYSLMSACGACQGAVWFSYAFSLFLCTLTRTITMTTYRWNTWTHNCTAVDPPETYVLPIMAPALVSFYCLSALFLL